MKNLLEWPSRFWSVGPSISETVYDGGLRRATVNQYIATYNADLAAYRQSVLTAFQQVEDYLAEVRSCRSRFCASSKPSTPPRTFLKLERRATITESTPTSMLSRRKPPCSNQQTLASLQCRR